MKQGASMYTEYKGYKILFEEKEGKIIVITANYCGIQCSYGEVFDSKEELKAFIDNGGWSCNQR
jgi:hypothetical protein